jgi:hypothetical protein
MNARASPSLSGHSVTSTLRAPAADLQDANSLGLCVLEDSRRALEKLALDYRAAADRCVARELGTTAQNRR